MIRLESERDEVRRILVDLIRLDTTNPPGNEILAATYLRNLLGRDGIGGEIVESAPGRASFIARLKGDGSRAPLLLMSHLDVVPVERSAWSVDPFAAVEKDGYLYGRGTLDIKNLVAMEAMVMMLLKRKRVPLARDVIFLAEADEEAGGRHGISWLVENHWEKIRAEFAINEGGDTSLSDGRILVACQCAEKGAGWYKIRFKGRGGHASAPHGENPIYRAAEAVRAIRTHTFPARRSPAVESYFRGLVGAGLLPGDLSVDELFDTPPENASAAARAVFSDHWMNAMLRNTITPTALEAGTQPNVIPAHVDLTVDTRRLPGVPRDEMIQALQDLAGREDAELTIIEDSDANSSPLGTELWGAIGTALRNKARSAVLAPYLSTGGTDSGALRARGVVCYGLEPSPAAPGELDRIHSHDERIRIESLWWGTELLFDTVEIVAAG